VQHIAWGQANTEPVERCCQAMIPKHSSSYYFLQNSVGLGRCGAYRRNRIVSIQKGWNPKQAY